jgi:hypothetical protein
MHDRTRRETAKDYVERLKVARKALGFQQRPLPPPLEGMLDESNYAKREKYVRAKRELKYRLNQKHRRKLNPNDVWYDKAYAAQWNAERKVRHDNNKAIRRIILTEVRAWQASNGKELAPTPPPDEDEYSGDELYPLEKQGSKFRDKEGKYI